MPDSDNAMDEVEEIIHPPEPVSVHVVNQSEQAKRAKANRASFVNYYFTGAETQALRILSRNPKRHKAIIIGYQSPGSDWPNFYMGTQAQVINHTGALIPPAVPIIYEAENEVWALPFQGNAGGITVIEELYE